MFIRKQPVLRSCQDALSKSYFVDSLAHEFDFIADKSLVVTIQEKTGGNKPVKRIPDKAELEIRRQGFHRQARPDLLKRNMTMLDGGDLRNRYALFAEQRLLFPIVFSQVRPEGLTDSMGRRPGDGEENKSMFMRDDH